MKVDFSPHTNMATSLLTPEVSALIQRIPLLRDAGQVHVEPLAGGASLNNNNYRLTVNNARYVLRYASESARFLGVRRDEELEAAQAAASMGIAPEILYSEPAGHLLMPYIRSRHWERDDFHDDRNLRRLAVTLRQLHSLTDLRGDGSVYRRIERLLESAASLRLEFPANVADCQARMADIEAMRTADTRFAPGLAHNDLWANNFLDDGDRLWLIDWEFAGRGDGLYDLTTTVLAGNYDEEEASRLLHAYGYDQPEDRRMLEAMKFIVRLFEGSWALVQHGLQPSSDFNYLDYSHRMFQKMSEQ